MTVYLGSEVMESADRNCFFSLLMVSLVAFSAIKNLRNEYYLNGDWVIDYSGALPIAGTTFYYQRGTEGDMAPETITARGPTTEPLVIEVRQAT